MLACQFTILSMVSVELYSDPGRESTKAVSVNVVCFNMLQ